ncbi:MAG: hypothetical protein JO287_20110 [Pseudonocardiales bacterium]|nr:hypothetical protein [Pseudonocardiales bacterium]
MVEWGQAFFVHHHVSYGDEALRVLAALHIWWNEIVAMPASRGDAITDVHPGDNSHCGRRAAS